MIKGLIELGCFCSEHAAAYGNACVLQNWKRPARMEWIGIDCADNHAANPCCFNCFGARGVALSATSKLLHTTSSR